jgi:alpha,alpha-trehalose phosphorylase
VAAISYEVTLLNSAAPVVISSEIVSPEGREQDDENDPRRAQIFGKALQFLAGYARDRRIVLVPSTKRSRMVLSVGVDHRLLCDCPNRCRTDHAENFGQAAFTIQAEAGYPIRLEKYMVYHTSGTASADEMGRRAEWTLDRVANEGFTKLLTEQELYINGFWRRSDVGVSNIKAERARLSTIEMQQAIRINLFHILQASARADDRGVAAKGLTGQAYEGHYFWDTEIYLLPFLTYTSPQTAKNLLRLRYSMLDQARARAKELGHPGALFPWHTISGEEASAYYEAGTAQYHINADIAYALRKYVNATGDEEFLFECGAEMLVETAGLWYDLGFFSDRKDGRFCINGVTGPDEYKTVVNNNSYTNLMARENLRFAGETVEGLRTRKPEAFESLMRRTGLDRSEVAAWRRAADICTSRSMPRPGSFPKMTASSHVNPGILRIHPRIGIRCCFFITP